MICLFNELGRRGVLRHLSNISDEIVRICSQSRYWRQSQYSPVSHFSASIKSLKSQRPAHAGLACYGVSAFAPALRAWALSQFAAYCTCFAVDCIWVPSAVDQAVRARAAARSKACSEFVEVVTCKSPSSQSKSQRC